MSKVLRVTLWTSPEERMITTFFTDDITVPVDKFLDESVPSGAFYTSEEFETADGEDAVVRAPLEALARFQDKFDDERNMAIMYFYDALALRQVKDDGVLASTVVAPLDAEQVAFVLKQLAKHPVYRRQTRVIVTKDKFLVELRRGEVNKKQMGVSTE